MSKIIGINTVLALNGLMQRLTDAYNLRERLIRKITEYNKFDDKVDSGIRYRFGKDIVEVMGKPNVNVDLSLDEIVAVAECRIKKSDATIKDIIETLKTNYDIQIEDR